MNRRTVLKQFAMATTAAIILPSCIADPKKVSIALNNLDVNGDEEQLLGLIADTLIPQTEIPGALAVKAHHFTFVMVDDCESKENKEKFLKGLRSFDDTCKEVQGDRFTKASPETRLAFLNHLEKNQETIQEDVKAFYSISKGYIIRGFVSSEYFLTEVKPYKLVPGPEFKGCYPVAQLPKTV